MSAEVKTPMLSATCNDVNAIRYPVYVSPKLDGVRAWTVSGTLQSRNLKNIRNTVTFNRFSHKPALLGLDGELLLGKHDATVYRRTQSAQSSYTGEPDMTLHVFDDPLLGHLPFSQRYAHLVERSAEWPDYVKLVPHKLVHSAEELLEYEAECLLAGYEGIMVRSPSGPYKHGRSTEREGWLLKVKQFADAEARIVGFEERMHNGNEATINALGHTERSSHQANLTGRGDLGALVVTGVNGPYVDVTFNIGTGFSDDDRDWFWAHRGTLMGRVVKYKYFPSGSKDKPRFPVWLGMRENGE